jgi:hypothetical protein
MPFSLSRLNHWLSCDPRTTGGSQQKPTVIREGLKSMFLLGEFLCPSCLVLRVVEKEEVMNAIDLLIASISLNSRGDCKAIIVVSQTNHSTRHWDISRSKLFGYLWHGPFASAQEIQLYAGPGYHAKADLIHLDVRQYTLPLGIYIYLHTFLIIQLLYKV